MTAEEQRAEAISEPMRQMLLSISDLMCRDKLTADRLMRLARETVKAIIAADPATDQLKSAFEMIDSVNQTNAAMGKRLKAMEAEIERLRAVMRGAAEVIDEHQAGNTDFGFGLAHWSALLRGSV